MFLREGSPHPTFPYPSCSLDTSRPLREIHPNPNVIPIFILNPLIDAIPAFNPVLFLFFFPQLPGCPRTEASARPGAAMPSRASSPSGQGWWRKSGTSLWWESTGIKEFPKKKNQGEILAKLSCSGSWGVGVFVGWRFRKWGLKRSKVGIEMELWQLQNHGMV